MANTVSSPNMSMPVPVPSVDPGPDWANNYNSCLSILDQHNHSPGQGVQITPAGININSDLPFNANNAISLRSTRYNAQGSPLAGASDLGCVYVSGVDLYFNDISGNQIRLTQGGSIVGTAGSISGLPSGTASAAYSGGTFIWQSATATAAAMDNGAVTIRDTGASAKGTTIQAFHTLAANYTLALPSGLPAATSLLQCDSSGNLGYPSPTIFVNQHSDNGDLEIAASTTLGIVAPGYPSWGIASNDSYIQSIGAAGIEFGNRTNGLLGAWLGAGGLQIGAGSNAPTLKINSGNLILRNTGGDLVLNTQNGIVTPNINNAFLSGNYGVPGPGTSTNTLAVGKAGGSSALPIVVSPIPATNGLMIVRGKIPASGTTPDSGEGFTYTHSNTSGTYALTFNPAFADAPSVVASMGTGILGNTGVTTSGISTSGVTFTTFSNFSAQTAGDEGFCFIAIGQRASAV